MKRFNKIVFFIFIFVAFFSVQAQDMSTMDVDSMSDSQVRKIWNSMKTKGYSLNQVELIMKSKGASTIQIDKLKSRVNSLDKNFKPTKQNENKGLLVDNTNDLEPFGIFDRTSQVKDVEKDSLYGYDFFNNPNITFSPNINVAVPDNYQLARGDVIQIDVWGAAEASYTKKLNRQADISLPNIGRIKLSGLDLGAAKTKIKSYLKRIYSGINASSSSYNKVYVGVALSKIRTVQVNLVGEVKTPGTYSLTSLSTVLNALYAAGGPSKEGDFRKISLFRHGKRVSDFDFYKYLIDGSEKGNLQLNDQDVIIVGAYKNLVSVVGEVKRPGYYQMKDGESIHHLFKFCGGLTADAYSQSINVSRIKGVGREIVEFDFNKTQKERVFNGDVIEVKRISEVYDNKVSIEGAVNVPGDYQFVKGLTVNSLIEKAAGVTVEAFLKRGIIKRRINKVQKKAIAFSLILGSEDILLQPDDELYIYKREELAGKKTFKILGAINNPSEFDYIEGMMIEDLIALSGGIKEGADINNIEVSRRVIDGGFEVVGDVMKLRMSIDLGIEKKKDFFLKPFDIVYVRFLKGYTKQKITKITGEVNYPGSYAIASKNDRISDLLERAGGLSKYAFVEGATLIRNKNSDIDNKQLAFLKELQKKDTVVTNDNLDKKQFRIGINLAKILKNKKGKDDLALEEGDELVVPPIKQTVEVRGEVYSPSLVPYVPGKSMRYYINNAGGFSNSAKKGKSYVVYSNGSIDATSNFLFIRNSPEIRPGATIFVPKKEITEGISTQEIIGITTGLATLATLISVFVK